MNRHKNGVIPRFLDAGKGVLHAGDIGKDLDPLLGQVPQQEPGNTEESRIPGGQHNYPLVGLFEEFQHIGQVGQGPFLAAEIREDIQMPLVPDHHLGVGNNLQRLGSEPFPAFDAGPDQINFRLIHNKPFL